MFYTTVSFEASLHFLLGLVNACIVYFAAERGGGAETELLQSSFHLQQDIRKTRKKKDCKKTKICTIAVIYYVKIENIQKKII